MPHIDVLAKRNYPIEHVYEWRIEIWLGTDVTAEMLLKAQIGTMEIGNALVPRCFVNVDKDEIP